MTDTDPVCQKSFWPRGEILAGVLVVMQLVWREWHSFPYTSLPASHLVWGCFNRIDMELYKCLPRLAERLRTPSAFTSDRDEDIERRLVIGSRLWLLVCKMAIE